MPWSPPAGKASGVRPPGQPSYRFAGPACRRYDPVTVRWSCPRRWCFTLVGGTVAGGAVDGDGPHSILSSLISVTPLSSRSCVDRLLLRGEVGGGVGAETREIVAGDGFGLRVVDALDGVLDGGLILAVAG